MNMTSKKAEIQNFNCLKVCYLGFSRVLTTYSSVPDNANFTRVWSTRQNKKLTLFQYDECLLTKI